MKQKNKLTKDIHPEAVKLYDREQEFEKNRQLVLNDICRQEWMVTDLLSRGKK